MFSGIMILTQSPRIINTYLRIYLDLDLFFFFQAEDGIRDLTVTGVQTCALPISLRLYPAVQERQEAIPHGRVEPQRPRVHEPGAGLAGRLKERFQVGHVVRDPRQQDRKSTRLNSSHSQISYAVFCLKKKKHAQTASSMRCTAASYS